MSITTKTTRELVKKHGQSAQDTGSAEVQVAILSTRIENITKHLKTNKFDVSSRRGLQRMVATRRGLLDWLKKNHNARYTAIVQSLELRK